jgi:hypothetical protein
LKLFVTFQYNRLIDNPQDTEKIHRYNRMFQFYKARRQKWLERAFEYEMLVHNDVDGTGTQFTSSQLEEIAAKHGIGTSVNFSIPVVETLQAFLTASQPIPDVIPVGQSTKESAYFWREVIQCCLHTNNFPEVQEQNIKDDIIVGRGLIFVRPATFYDDNDFNVVLEPLDYRYYYPDPTCRLRNHQDQEMFFIARPLLENKAKKMYNLTDEEIKWASNIWDGGDLVIDNPAFQSYGNNSGTMEDSGQKTIWTQEIYEKVKAPLYVFSDGTKTFKKPESFINEQGQMVMVEKTITKIFVKRVIKIGNLIKSETIIPITLYPIVIYGHTHNRNPYEYGVMHNFADLNNALNKFVALLVENAQQSSNSNWTAPTGAITDKAKFERDSNVPGRVLEYDFQQGLPDGGRPTRNLPLPLNNAFYTLFTIFKSLIEYVTGILPLLQGSNQDAPDTAGATNTLANFGMQRPKLYARRIDSANTVLGKLIIQMYQAFAPEENVMRYISNTSAMVEIMSNVRIRIEQTEEGQQILQTNNPQDKLASIVQVEGEKQAHIIYDDISTGDYNVIFKSSNNLPSTRAQAVEFLKTLLGRMSNDSMSVAVTEALFELAEVAEADQVLRKMNAVNQANQELEQQKQVNEELNKKVEQLANKLEQQILATKEAEIESAVEIRKAKADALLDEMSTKVKEDKAEAKAAAKKKKVEYS